MKTNHKRGFKDKRFSRQVFAKYEVLNYGVVCKLSDRVVSGYVNSSDHCCGKRGIRRDRKGAKKFVNSRFRFHEDMALKKLVKEL